MADRIFAWAREALLGGTLDLDNVDAVVVLLDSTPPLTAVTLSDLTGAELARDDATLLVSLGNPSAVSLATGPTLDPDPGETAGYVVCTDGATDDDRQPLVWVPITPTDDPVTASTDALITLAGQVDLGDLASVDLATPPNDGDVLTWDATAQRWIAQAP